MKYSVFTVVTPEYGIEETVKKLHEIGYEGVEWRVAAAPPSQKPANYAYERRYWSYNKSTLDIEKIEEQAVLVKKACETYSVSVPILSTYLSLYDIEKIEKVMRAANTMKCDMVRLCVPTYDGSKNYNLLFEEAVEQAKCVVALAKKYHIRVIFHIHHGNIISSASAAYRFVTNFSVEQVGLIYDPGNMVHEGYENYKLGIELLGKYIAHIHIKNAKPIPHEDDVNGITNWVVEWDETKKGIANFTKFMEVLKESGYNGYVSVSDFSNRLNTDDKLIENLSFLKELEKKEN